jgi:hypothetical protein
VASGSGNSNSKPKAAQKGTKVLFCSFIHCCAVVLKVGSNEGDGLKQGGDYR